MSCVHTKSLHSYQTLCFCIDCGPPGSSLHGSPSMNTRVGCPALLQGIFQTQGSNPCIKPMYPVSPALAGGFFLSFFWQAASLTLEPPGKPNNILLKAIDSH